MLAKLGLVTSLFWGLSVAQDYTDECPVDNGFFADAVQCDRYYECKNGEIIDHLCPDGLVYDESSVNFAKCSFQFSVDCSGRTELQPPTPSKLCPRLNGYFAHEDPNVCDKFYFCVDGVANLVSCPNTLIFDPTKGQCDFVDQVTRKGCSSAEVYKFACPKTSNSPHAHPRYPDPEDCQFFYLCIGGVSARRNGCTEGLVFNPDTVSCDRQSNVKGPCSTWYNETELARIKNPSSFPQSKISGNTPRERVNFRRKPVVQAQAQPEPDQQDFSNFASIGDSSILRTARPNLVRSGSTKLRPAQQAASQNAGQRNRVRTRVRRPPPAQRPTALEEEDKPLTFALSSDEAIQRFREQNQFVPTQSSNGGEGGRLTILTNLDPRPERLSPQESSFNRQEEDEDEKFSSFPALPRSRTPPQFQNFEAQREVQRTESEPKLPELPEQPRQDRFRTRGRNPSQSRRPPPEQVEQQFHSERFQTDFGQEQRQGGTFQRSEDSAPAPSGRSRLQVTQINVNPRRELAQGEEDVGDFELQRIPNARGRQRARSQY